MSLIGTHVSIAGGLDRAIERGQFLGCEAIQIFTKNQRQWKTSSLSLGRSLQFLKAWSESEVSSVVVHASYLINLAAAGELRAKSITALIEEVDRCDMLGIDEIVVHPGSHGGDGISAGLERIVSALGEVLERTEYTRVRILLETMAGQGNFHGASMEEHEMIMDSLSWHDRLGICLDTCHLFAAGYELRFEESYQRLIRYLEKHIGLERVGCWHLNDSRMEKGSHIDRHEHLGYGRIGPIPFGLIVTDERWKDVPCILETPKTGIGDEGNLSLLRKIRGK